jgi:hypothetical protein
LDARLTNLFCKKITVAKSKEVNAGCNLAKSSKEGYSSKRALLQIMMIGKKAVNTFTAILGFKQNGYT